MTRHPSDFSNGEKPSISKGIALFCLDTSRVSHQRQTVCNFIDIIELKNGIANAVLSNRLPLLAETPFLF
jgi:hypothetical protein